MERTGALGRFAPSIGDVLFLSIFFWTLHNGVLLLNDGDTNWHIVTGRNIIAGLGIPYTDPYSHTMPGAPWTSHEWLAAVVLAAFYNSMGLNGVVLLVAAVISLTFYFLYRYMLYTGVKPVLAALMTVLAASASTLHWLARPHVFSLPLTLAFFAVLDTYQRGDKDRLFLLPLLTALWANLHGGFILGIILITIYCGGNLLVSLFRGEDGGPARAKFRKLGLVLVLCLAAACVNPHGPSILYFPFHLVGRQFIMDNVMEWLSPNFHTDKTFEAMLLVFVVAFVMSRRKPDVFEGATALLLTHMSLYSSRYIPLMALVVTPMAAARGGGIFDEALAGSSRVRLAKRVLERMKKVSERVTPLELVRRPRILVYASLAACLVVALNGGRIAGAGLMDYHHDKEKFPVDAMDFALANGVQGRMYNNDGWGGYIIYRSYPRYKVFFDGRSDMYGVPLMKEYIKVAWAKPGFRDVLDKYKVDWVIYNVKAPLCRLLVEGGGWKLVYADKTAAVILRDTPANRPLTEKFKNAHFPPVSEEN